jgi:hypothetical protein
LAGVTDEGSRPVAGRKQLADNVAADHARGAGDKNRTDVSGWHSKVMSGRMWLRGHGSSMCQGVRRIG